MDVLEAAVCVAVPLAVEVAEGTLKLPWLELSTILAAIQAPAKPPDKALKTTVPTIAVVIKKDGCLMNCVNLDIIF